MACLEDRLSRKIVSRMRTSERSEPRTRRGWEVFVAVLGALLNAIFAFILGLWNKPSEPLNKTSAAIESSWKIDEGLLVALVFLGGLCATGVLILLIGKLLDVLDTSELLGVDIDDFDS